MALARLHLDSIFRSGLDFWFFATAWLLGAWLARLLACVGISQERGEITLEWANACALRFGALFIFFWSAEFAERAVVFLQAGWAAVLFNFSGTMDFAKWAVDFFEARWTAVLSWYFPLRYSSQLGSPQRGRRVIMNDGSVNCKESGIMRCAASMRPSRFTQDD